MALIFAYGSLAARPGRVEHRLPGFVRTWGVAMDNRVDLPGYKHYLDPGTGERPACHVAFLTIEAAAGRAVNGVLVEAPPAALAALDARERNYRRVHVTEHVEPAPVGEVDVYVGTDDARRRRAAAAAAGTCVVDAGYLEAVRAGFAALGLDALERFDASTRSPGCPVRPLVRRNP